MVEGSIPEVMLRAILCFCKRIHCVRSKGCATMTVRLFYVSVFFIDGSSTHVSIDRLCQVGGHATVE